ncbi:MAG: TRAP transporter substrate-binding protein [Desulfuromonas thiophila]|nr:TRAP transporter substrate-binding protein [Desulfuromonas thiophila]
MSGSVLSRLLTVLMAFIAFTSTGHSRDLSILQQWQPAFDPSGAEYTYILSNVDHPAIAGIGVGYKIRDRLWQESGGRLYVDFRPLAQLGGEKDVVSKLKLGAVQGMLCSSVAAANIAPVLGIVNLPFLIDSPQKLETFRARPELFEPFRAAARQQGIEVIDFTGYGSYGWATTRPVRSLADAASVNFRIAQAPVNADVYKAWKLKFTVMPWPDVPQALQTGVIDGLDHTPMVCSITKKFDVARYFTDLHYAQGLYIHLVNKRWLDRLPEDLRQLFLRVVAEESASARQQTELQQQQQIAEAQAAGVTFLTLPDSERDELRRQAAPVIEKWRATIGPAYLDLVRQQLH